MSKKLAKSMFALVAFAASPAVYAKQPHLTNQPTQNWKLVFSDEFSGAFLDKSKWTQCYWWADDNCTNSGNREMQLYRKNSSFTKDGYLYLRADFDAGYDRKGRFYPYSSGIVTSGISYSERPAPARFSFQYGFVEARAKIPSGKGLWPAFWLLPETWKSRPEIDIMEILGDTTDKLRVHFHFLDELGERESAGETIQVSDLSKNWHIYGLLWTEDHIAWYLDGNEMWRFDKSEYVPAEPLYFIANLAVGGEWPGAPDKHTRFPSDFIIDYVRIWQQP